MAGSGFGMHRDVLDAVPSDDASRTALVDELKGRGNAAFKAARDPAIWLDLTNWGVRPSRTGQWVTSVRLAHQPVDQGGQLSEIPPVAPALGDGSSFLKRLASQSVGPPDRDFRQVDGRTLLARWSYWSYWSYWSACGARATSRLQDKWL